MIDAETYSAWRHIDYRPAISELLPAALTKYVTGGQSVLDIGCNAGNAAFFLAKLGVRVIGIDLNPEAIQKARDRALSECVSESPHFEVVDILQSKRLEVFDAVLLIRTLTCFHVFSNWESILNIANAHLKGSGLIYIHDFMTSPENERYRTGYQEGKALGWRTGNFPVRTPSGSLLFVAHHHSEEELKEITTPYESLHLTYHKSLSMNGNECRMFEFIGRKP